MTDTLALEKLFLDVTDLFATEGTDAENLFGWRAPAEQKKSERRIAWVPGDPAGAVGELDAPRNPGQNPRPLATLYELFTCHLGAVDALQPQNELAQYKAARLLYDTWLRACVLSARNTFRVVSATWVTDKKELPYGAALRVVCTIEAMVPDLAQSTMPTDTAAALAVSHGDNTEHQTVTGSDTL